MDPRTLATAQALGRVGFGAALVLVPELVGRAWIGRRGAHPDTGVMATAVGARDLALGLGLIQAIRGGRGAGPWLGAAVIADGADLLATLRARRAIPSTAVAGVGALAGGSVGLGLYLLRALDQAAP